MKRKLTKREAEKRFRKEILPLLDERFGKDDKPARREEWNNWTDYLCRNGEITQRQYETWDNPF